MTSDRPRRRPRFAALTLAAILPALTAGCESEQPPGTSRQVVTLDQVPAPVLGAAQKALPGVKFDDAWKNVDTKTRALHSYEVRGRNSSGKIREVRVSPTGEVLEME